MTEPGAIGTLLIGLGEERRHPQGGYRPDGFLPRRPRRAVRPVLAITLRRVADVLEPRHADRDADRPVSEPA